MEYFTLNNGIKMPMAGIGVFLMSPAEGWIDRAVKFWERNMKND